MKNLCWFLFRRTWENLIIKVKEIEKLCAILTNFRFFCVVFVIVGGLNDYSVDFLRR
jgi:hypothetical protein